MSYPILYLQFPVWKTNHTLKWEGVWRELGCLARTASFSVREESGHSLKSSLSVRLFPDIFLKHYFEQSNTSEGYQRSFLSQQVVCFISDILCHVWSFMQSHPGCPKKKHIFMADCCIVWFVLFSGSPSMSCAISQQNCLVWQMTGSVYFLTLQLLRHF